MSRRAVILAGGAGTRLRPYTVVLPKPLMPIGEYPILEVIVRQLTDQGFDHITMAVNHQAEVIKAFFEDGSKWNARIDYSLEENALGTMGPLKIIEDLPENFLVMNGDILTDLDFSTFHDNHVTNENIFTISSYVREQLIDYGVLETNADGNLVRLREKPVHSYEVSMGIYMVNKKVLGYIPDNMLFGFDNLMHAMVEKRDQVIVKRYNGYWLDIGRPDDYMQAIDEFEGLKHKLINE